MTTPITFRADASRPCPVCLSPSKGCSATADRLHICRGEPAAPGEWRVIPPAPDSMGFTHYRNNVTDPPPATADRDASPSRPRRPSRRKTGAGANGTAPAHDWEATARRYAAGLRDTDRQFLAQRLGVPVEALDSFPLLGASGASSAGSTITFPEHDGEGRVIGLSERVPGAGPDGTDAKRQIHGGRRGLTVPDGWDLPAGPVYVVEGPSDTIAAFAAGLACVGRPGAAAGIDLLVRQLRDVPAGRDLVVVGENDRKPTGEWPGRDGAVAVAAALAAKLARPVRVAMPPAGAKDVRAWLTDAELEYLPWAQRGRQLVAHLGSPVAIPPPPSASAMRRKQITAGFNEFEVNSQAITALAEHDATFTRGGALVGVAWQAATRLKNCEVHIPAGPKIALLSKATLRERLTVVADWRVEKEDTSGGTMLVQSRPPDWCTAAVLDRGTWPGIRPLVGIAEFPVFLPDGSILSTPGYDASSGLYYLPAVPVEVTVPDAPTAADADAALRTLSESVCDFPFVSDHHRSAWLAGLLTPLARFAFTGPSPLFLVEANVPGAGKGLLVSTANLIVRGDSSAVLEFSRDAEELQKVLTALLIQGESIAMFDNVEGTLGGGVLNKLLTAELWEGRILGTSSTVRVPNLCTWWCTGNNVSVLGDTARRVCAIRLESPLEIPVERTDLHHDDLPAWVRSSRPRLLSAALTVLRAFHAAGRPTQDMRAWGSYTPWSNLVRAAIVWAGWPDPLGDGTAVRQEDDPTRGAMRVLLEQWTDIDPDRAGLTSARVIEKVEELGSLGTEELKEAVQILAPKSSKNRAGTLGFRFREYFRRSIGRYRLDKKPVRRGLIYWFVSDLKSGLFGGDGDNPGGGHGGHGGHGSPPSRARSHAPARGGLEQSEPCPPSPPCTPPETNGHPSAGDFPLDVSDLTTGGDQP